MLGAMEADRMPCELSQRDRGLCIHEPDHHHAARRIQPQRAAGTPVRDVAADLAASGEGGAGGGRRWTRSSISPIR